MYDQNTESSVIRTVRTMLSSPLFLVGAIGYSVYGLFELLGGIAGNAAGSSMLNSLLNNLGSVQGGYGMSDNYLQMYMGAYSGVSLLGTLISAVPVILLAVGMWLLFASAKGGAGINLTGLAMIRVIVIIQMVCACITVVLVEIVCIVVIAGVGSIMSYLETGYEAGTIMILAMLVVAGIAAAEIIYYLKLLKTIRTMKDTIISGMPDSRVSKYVEIFCYIAGGFSGLSALFSLAGMSIYGFLGDAGLATANIVFAIYIMKYRQNMEQLMRSPNTNPQPQYQETTVQPQYQVPPAQPQYQAPSAQPQYQAPPAQPQYDETTVLQYYNETSVLSGQFLSGGQMQLVRMTRQKTGETFCISKPSFWIGKDAANVDYCISDNSAISRRHVLVTIQNGGCCVRDNHSTNRVFLNGQMIRPDTDTPVSDGDRVRLGDEEFIVNIG